MTCPSLSLLCLCVWIIWTSQYAAGCGERQRKVVGQCCDLCPPGKYMKKPCSEHHQTECSSCAEGSFSDQYHFFDTCEECKSCQEYAQKCTPTTNANCSCRPGFLCSNNVCSKCEENKCVMGERLNRTGLIGYSYHCEPLCPDAQYFDVKKNICKKRTECSLLGFPELFPGNKTHDSVCDRGERTYGELIHVILGLGFVLISLILLGLLSYACIKNLRKYKPADKPEPVPSSICDFHLSKEESGFQLIIQDKSENNSLCDSYVDKVTSF
ncbi:tumor necrosis factor receptor superfamily member 18 [Cheilinus undulatus]|uniref:tumor necrosis factor receptor superfamily member 18 n=1 Tax=Cheilinus undulatus TaxID=241271 RepID=UPI001BD248C1|nr:tumor necrosis factor receptor superfamily member 18 [Cheilinus undulatus]